MIGHEPKEHSFNLPSLLHTYKLTEISLLLPVLGAVLAGYWDEL